MGELPYVWYGKTFTSNHLFDTLMRKNFNGCDSFVSLNISIRDHILSYRSKGVCLKELPFTWYNRTFTELRLKDTVRIINRSKCDSLLILTLKLLDTVIEKTHLRKACHNELPISWYGKMFSAIHMIDTAYVTNSSGCDSFLTLNVTIDSIDSDINSNNDTLSSKEVGANYQWLDCSKSMNAISGANRQIYVVTASGNYAVEVSKNGCKDTSDCIPIVHSEINRNKIVPPILIYPNPSNGEFSIQSDTQFELIRIIDLEGKLIYESDYPKQSFNLDVPSGIDRMELRRGDKAVRELVIIE